MPDVTGVDIWTINAYESQYYEYSRFNYNIRKLYTPAPFAASDHNPELVGIAVDDRATPTILAEHLPQKVKVNKTRAVLGVAVFAKGERPTGTVTVTLPDGRIARGGAVARAHGGPAAEVRHHRGAPAHDRVLR